MALVKCAECSAQISNSATTCPQCGAKQPKKTSLVVWVVGALFALAIGKAILSSNDGGSLGSPVAAEKEITQADRELYLGIAAVKSIKQGMKNPDSFKLESFLIFPGGATCVEYRGTNSFDAIVPGKAVFQPKSESILTSNRNGNKFVKAWNELCTKAGGSEHAKGLNLLGAI